jgi:hypothetical protein
LSDGNIFNHVHIIRLKKVASKYAAFDDEFLEKEIAKKTKDLESLIRQNVHLEFYNLMNGEYEMKMARQDYASYLFYIATVLYIIFYLF